MDHDISSAIDDIDLAASIAAALEMEPAIPRGITVDVSDAVVTLEGNVENPGQREAAELVVRRFQRAICIINTITIGRAESA